MVEHRPDDRLDEAAREFVGELELDLARILRERAESPFPLQLLNGPSLSVTTMRSGGVFALSVVKCAFTPW